MLKKLKNFRELLICVETFIMVLVYNFWEIIVFRSEKRFRALKKGLNFVETIFTFYRQEKFKEINFREKT